MRPSSDGGLLKALVMHKEFGAVSSVHRENAWVSAKRQRDPCRGQSVSPEVSRGVNGHDCRTWGYTRSPPSFLLLFFMGCLQWLVPERLGVRSSTAPLACHTNWNRKWLSASGETTTLLENKHKCEAKDKMDGRSCTSKERAWLMSVEDAGSQRGWLKADTGLKTHEYSVTN